ncbi:MAG: DUF1080 domain-containing protein [Bacteroidales bacterium]|jgi:hypothetical protein|nr:DUF1080 domain-containing protein [Bacteroidales bacterium]
MKFIFLCTSIIALTIGCAGKDKGGWVKLFNGRNLDGWVQLNGKAEYRVENREIVGISQSGTPNSFLCTKQDYGDFILEMEVKIDTSLNSGIQIRSHSLPEYKDGRVHGYQVEIDPSKRGWSGGIYDEARAGWLYPVTPHNPSAVSAFRNSEWNHYRIEAVGNHIKTWVNGIPAADLLTDADASGFIALQVHAINAKTKPWSEGATVRWRNIRIMTARLEAGRKTDTPPVKQVNVIPNTLSDREKADGWILLFDGQTAAGWRGALSETFPGKGWNIHDGTMEAIPRSESGGGNDIVTTGQYDHFEIVFDFKLSEGANSGLKYYVTENGYGKGALGLEYQILDDERHPDAKQGRDGNRKLASLYDLIPAGNKRFNGIGQWNTGRIIAVNGHVEHWLNGFKILEYERGSDAYRKLVAESKFAGLNRFGEAPQGHILLQYHNDRVWFRNIKIRRISPISQ